MLHNIQVPKPFRVTVKTFRKDEPVSDNIFKDHPDLIAGYPTKDDVAREYVKAQDIAERENKFFLIAVHEKENRDIEIIEIDELFPLHDIIINKKNFRKEYDRRFSK